MHGGNVAASSESLMSSVLCDIHDKQEIQDHGASMCSHIELVPLLQLRPLHALQAAQTSCICTLAVHQDQVAARSHQGGLVCGAAPW